MPILEINQTVYNLSKVFFDITLSFWRGETELDWHLLSGGWKAENDSFIKELLEFTYTIRVSDHKILISKSNSDTASYTVEISVGNKFHISGMSDDLTILECLQILHSAFDAVLQLTAQLYIAMSHPPETDNFSEDLNGKDIFRLKQIIIDPTIMLEGWVREDATRIRKETPDEMIIVSFSDTGKVTVFRKDKKRDAKDGSTVGIVIFQENGKIQHTQGKLAPEEIIRSGLEVLDETKAVAIIREILGFGKTEKKV